MSKFFKTEFEIVTLKVNDIITTSTGLEIGGTGNNDNPIEWPDEVNINN